MLQSKIKDEGNLVITNKATTQLNPDTYSFLSDENASFLTQTQSLA